MIEYPICFRTDCGRVTDENCWHNRRGLPICESCHDMLYVLCDYCETSVYPEFFEPALSRCNSCVEDSGYSICPGCEDWEVLGWNGLCDYCEENRESEDGYLGSGFGLDGLVVEYHNGAHWLDRGNPAAGNYFRGSAAESFWRGTSYADAGDSSVYFGLEFEFEDPNSDMRPAIERIMDSELGHVETDGSLDSGLELITRPADMEAWRGRFGYEFATARAAIVEAGGTFNACTTGQHIHVSRSAFTGGLSHLARLAIFVQHAANTEYIFQLSGKTRYNFDRYSHCNKYAASYYLAGRNRSEFRRALVEKLDDRSRAVNLTKDGTIELRFWAGSNSEADVHGSLEWTAAVIEYLSDIGSAEINGGALLCQSFNTWLLDQEGRFPLAVRLVLSRVKVDMLG